MTADQTIHGAIETAVDDVSPDASAHRVVRSARELVFLAPLAC